MSTEYRLNYTGSEIDAKLSVIDGSKRYYTSAEVDEKLEGKQDNLAFDSTPTEGSENPVTSGGVYTAIQNATPNLTYDEAPTEGSENLVKSGAVYTALQNVGGTDLVAGDLLEIKDGVIRSTLGDLLSDETEETLVEFHHADNIEMGDQGDGTYVYGAEGILTSPIDINEKLTIEFNLSDGTNKTFNTDVTSEYDGEGTLYFGLYNCISGDDGLIKVDENLDAIYFECGVNGEEFSLAFVTFEDYTGASVTIGQSKVVERKVYATLPDNALAAGNLIKIENGVVSSTLSFDEEPIEGSENPITSGGVYEVLMGVNESLGAKQDNLTFDSAPTEGSENPVTSGGIYTALQNIEVSGGGSCEPQLIEGLVYDVDDSGNIDLSTRGLSANRGAVPTGKCAWIEGAASSLGDASNNENVSQTYFKVSKRTVGKNTVTDSFIYIECSDADTATEMRGHITRAYVASIVFEDTPDKVYFVKPGSYTLSDTQVYFSFTFPSDQETFPVDSEVTRNIQNLIFYPANGDYSHAEGYNTYARGNYSHAEGYETLTDLLAECSHAEGNSTMTFGNGSHAEGNGTTARGDYSHAEGCGTTATSDGSHAEGRETNAEGKDSHAEGYNTHTRGNYSHAEGYGTTTLGESSHAEGYGTYAYGAYSHVEGKFNIQDSDSKYVHIVGNGSDSANPSNAYTLDWDGNAWYAGTVEASGIILSSTTEGSTKKFRITVDDAGTLTATEIVE